MDSTVIFEIGTPWRRAFSRLAALFLELLRVLRAKYTRCMMKADLTPVKKLTFIAYLFMLKSFGILAHVSLNNHMTSKAFAWVAQLFT